MARLSLFAASALQMKPKPFKHQADSAFAEAIARKQQVMGVNSPHPSTKASGPPVKRVSK